MANWDHIASRTHDHEVTIYIIAS